MKSKLWICVLVMFGLFLAACGGQVPTTEEVPSVEDILPPQVAAEILNQVSETLGVSIEDIQINSVEQQTWSDSCLGLGGPEESCAAVETPGWLVVYTINGEEFRYRADQTGSVIRQEP